jgi:hypothetical protein
VNGTDTNTYAEFVSRVKTFGLEPYIMGQRLHLAVAHAMTEYRSRTNPSTVDPIMMLFNTASILVHREPPISFERLVWLLEAAGSLETLARLANDFPPGTKLGSWKVAIYDRKTHVVASFVTLELDPSALPENVSQVDFYGSSSDLGWDDWNFHVIADLGEGMRDYWLALVSKDWDTDPQTFPTAELKMRHQNEDIRFKGKVLGEALTRLLPNLGLFDYKPQHKKVKGGYKPMPVNDYLIWRWQTAPWR